jgi:intraflagellar transport protein 122
MSIKRSEPIWSLAWNPNPLPSKNDSINAQEALSVACWDQTLSFYGINGQQIGKDKKLGFDPLCVSFFGSGDFMLVSGTNRKTFLFNREGIKLSVVSEGLSDWIWACRSRYEPRFANPLFVNKPLQTGEGDVVFPCSGVSFLHFHKPQIASLPLHV